MKNKNLSMTMVYLALSNIGTLGAGFGLGYLFFKKKLEQQLIKQYEYEIDSYKGYLDIKVNSEKHNREQDDMDGVEETNNVIDTLNYNSVFKKNLNPADIVQAKYTRPGDDDEPYTSDLRDFSIINSDIFDEADETVWDKITVNYYIEDAVLTNMDDSIIDDLYTVFGDASNMSEIENMLSTEESVYVRNHNINTMFEIIPINSSYTLEVLGYEEEPIMTHRPPRKMRDDYDGES